MQPDGNREAQATVRLEFHQEEGPGAKIGRYKLLEELGEGGMGIVYLAEQEEPVRRRVALKIIKLGMDTREVVARFEAERQALAMMDHPNIARVLDGGATGTGRPYFVMELVQGAPITEFCDQHKLPARERLKLFVQVCQAIQSAHQKAVIHRDIKPSNVLVTLRHGEPMPKVIDFGIAKATGQKLTDKTLYTQFQQFIGTPAYMSPEQAEMSGLDIDTRSDIYSLGVLLYELLTGSTPFDTKELFRLGVDEMRKIIREREPVRPGARLSQKRAAQPPGSGDSALRAPHSALDADLDWIVMKCLEKDRRRRYETANGLAADILRHLNNEPVVARPPSAAYRLQKMVRRHRAAALAVAAVALTLVLALAFSTAAFVRERRALRRANTESVRADSVAKFVINYFDAAIPDLMQRGDGDAVRQLLNAADQLASSLSNAPQAEAEVRFNIGRGYFHTLLDFPLAEAQFQAVDKLDVPGQTARHLAGLARAERVAASMWGQWDTNAALELRRIGAQALARKPPDTQVSALAFSGVSLFYAYLGAGAEAEALARNALGVAPDDAAHRPSRILALDVLAGELANRGELAEANEFGGKLLGMAPVLQTGAAHDKTSLRLFMDVLTLYGLYNPEERALSQILATLPGNTELSVVLTGMLGVSTGARGDWRRGLDLLAGCATNPLCPVTLWCQATYLAALVGDHDLRRSLCALGVAHYVARSDIDASRILVEPLLLFQPDPSILPLTRELVDRALKGGPRAHARALLQSALLDYRLGQFPAAAGVLKDYLESLPGTRDVTAGLHEAKGWFLLSMVEMKSHRLEPARAAYQRGLRLHAATWRPEGAPVVARDWAASCAAEFLRREAASLLGQQTPARPDS